MRCGSPPSGGGGIPGLIADWSRKHPALARTEGGPMPDGASERSRRTRVDRHRTGSRGLSQVAAALRRRVPHRVGRARRLALLSLFEDEFRPDQADAALERLAARRACRRRSASTPDGSSMACWSIGSELDAEIARHAPAIPVSELGIVERTILRSAIYEVLYSAATSSGETIHDAVSLARTYAGDAARRLVNGVLGSVSRPSGAIEEPETGDRRNHLRPTQEDHRRAARR